MAPTMPVSAPLAGGSKSATARCGATRCRRMRCASVVCLPGVATSSTRRTEPSWQDSCNKQELPRILTAFFLPDLSVPIIEQSLYISSPYFYLYSVIVPKRKLKGDYVV